MPPPPGQSPGPGVRSCGPEAAERGCGAGAAPGVRVQGELAGGDGAFLQRGASPVVKAQRGKDLNSLAHGGWLEACATAAAVAAPRRTAPRLPGPRAGGLKTTPERQKQAGRQAVGKDGRVRGWQGRRGKEGVRTHVVEGSLLSWLAERPVLSWKGSKQSIVFVSRVPEKREVPGGSMLWKTQCEPAKSATRVTDNSKQLPK